MSELSGSFEPSDIQDLNPLPIQIEDVGKAFVEWAEKGWAIKKAYDNMEEPNSESAGWEIVKPYFINKINELVKNRKPENYPPGYYKLEIRDKNKINNSK